MSPTFTPSTPLILRAGQTRRSYRYLGPDTTGECLLTAADTGGAFSLFDIRFGPGAGVPPHVHANEDEIFYVLEGKFRFQVGEEVFHAGPGACLHGKRGVAHSPLNIGETPGRVLVVTTPGGFEQFFDALEETGGMPSVPTPGDLEKAFALLARYGMQPGMASPEGTAVEVTAVTMGACDDRGAHRGWVCVSSQETSGSLLMAYAEADKGGGVPPHIHAREDETFYLLSGLVAVEADGQLVEAGAGDVVFAPRHLPHSWFAVSDEPVRALVIVTPGANFETFAAEMAKAQIVPNSLDTIAQLTDLAAHYGIEMLPPIK